MPDPKDGGLANAIASSATQFSDKDAGSAVVACPKAAVDEAKRAALMARITSGGSQLSVQGDDKFTAATLDALDRLSRTPTGFGLLSSLDSAGKKTRIVESTTVNSEGASDFNAGLRDETTGKPGPGSDNSVLFNPERKKLNGEPWMTRDPAIGLGHELIHAEHDVRGTTDGRQAVEYVGADGKRRKAPGYELQAVGLGEHASNDYTENKLRKDFADLKLGENTTEVPRPRY